MTAIVDSKAPGSENRLRCEKAIKEKAFDLIRNKVILETKAEDLQAVLNAGRVSTNVFLRRIQNYCIGMNWLPWPLLPKKQFSSGQVQGEAGHHPGRTPADHRARE